jgi:hypothetical protein
MGNSISSSPKSCSGEDDEITVSGLSVVLEIQFKMYKHQHTLKLSHATKNDVGHLNSCFLIYILLNLLNVNEGKLLKRIFFLIANF